MNINWRVRVQKKSFWVSIISALIVFANSIASALGFDLVPLTDTLETALMALLNVLVVAGVIEDMTTRGYQDSEQAKGYTTPK
ncbi:phage holin [Salinicoccus albus]|uniref:phage holin n=1 Tax=Salinicoccus albus TaxID=418756 RepID=UPI00036C2EE2|nr:phage holin [Salinicoccus albus]